MLSSTRTRAISLAMVFSLLGCGPREAAPAVAPNPGAAGASTDGHAPPRTARELAERIVRAHGGLERWRAAKSVSLLHRLDMPGEATPWVSRDTVEQTPTRRLYQEWLSPPGHLAFDGRDVWTLDWTLGNPPRVMPFLTYLSLIGPWLAFDAGASLAGPELAAIAPEGPRVYPTLTIRLPRDPSRPPTAGYYKLYADPTTYVVHAVAYNVTYGKMLDVMGLPPGVDQVGPMTHVFEAYANVDGLLVPTRYVTYGPRGAIAGQHTVSDWAFDRPFDEARLARPAGAEVDRSRDERAAPGR